MKPDAASLAPLYYGTSQVEAGGQRLEAGPWSMLFIEGALRDVRYCGIEVIRGIAWLVRDADWGTCRATLRSVEIVTRADAFHVSYAAQCANPAGQALNYTVAIEGEANGTLEFRAHATAQTDFVAARCGFVVLHPIDGVAGAPAQIEHTDGAVEVAVFPVAVDPWQPFKDLRAISYRGPGGLTVRCSLTGDVFEMEDQRNWTDASFKTYSRPLELPWPYTMAAGSVHAQSVRLEVEKSLGHVSCGGHNGAGNEREPLRMAASPSPASERPFQPLTIELDEPAGVPETMPALGVAIAPDETGEALANLSLLTELAPQQLSLHFDPLAGHGPPELERFAELQRCSGIAAVLECALPGIDEPEPELRAIARQIRAAGLVLTGIVVSPSVHRQSNPPGSVSPPCPPLDEVYRAARRALPDLRLGGGVLSYFTELNRKRPPLELVDWVTHATCPIVHAADDRSVMQTIEAIAHVTRSCRALIGPQPYAIGPVSIGMRQNPYGSRVMPNPLGERVAMAGDDPRQRGLFGAAWLLGYAAALEGAALECFTLGALTGPRGLAASAGPVRHPAFHVAAALARMAGAGRLTCRSGRAQEVASCAARDPRGQVRWIVANLTAKRQSVRLQSGIDLGVGMASIATLDETSAGLARSGAPPAHSLTEDILHGHEPIELAPFACVQIASAYLPFGHPFPA